MEAASGPPRDGALSATSTWGNSPARRVGGGPGPPFFR